jgi:hypothetical protein
MSTRIETREVLAVAYPPRIKDRTFLRHAVVVDESGEAVSVLCRRVALDNLAHETTEDRDSPPTCPQCVRKLAKIRQAEPLHEGGR